MQSVLLSGGHGARATRCRRRGVRSQCVRKGARASRGVRRASRSIEQWRRRSRRPGRRRRGRTVDCAGGCRSGFSSVRDRGRRRAVCRPAPLLRGRSRSHGRRVCADRCVLGSHQIERADLERCSSIGIGVEALDRQAASIRLCCDAVEGSQRDVRRGDLPTLVCQPQCVCAFACADIECPASVEARDLVDERAIGVAAPHPVAAVAVIPVVPDSVSVVWRRRCPRQRG
jgi:hypothetical protein